MEEVLAADFLAVGPSVSAKHPSMGPPLYGEVEDDGMV